MNETNWPDCSQLPVSLARAALSDSDWRFLRIVHLAGGYVMRRQATGLGLGRSRTVTQQRLQDLVRLGFLAPVSLGTDPRRPHAYKLTARALTGLGDPNSHIRRRHTEPTILHKLLRLEFIAEQQRAGRVRLALSSEKKRAWFETQGFAPDLLPRNDDWPEIIGQDAERLYIYHIDQFHRQAQTQLRQVLQTYAQALASGGPGLKLIVVVATAAREQVYRYLIATLSRMYAAEIGVLRVEWWPFGRQRHALLVQVVT